MSIPKTLEKIINKYHSISDFDIDRIARSIGNAIMATAQEAKWSSQKRAEIYAKRIERRIYREFYDLDYLKTDFIIKYINFDPEERLRRLENAMITKRITVVLIEMFRDAASIQDIDPFENELKVFIEKEVFSTKVDPKYTEGLFPLLNVEQQCDIVGFLHGKIIELNKQPLDKFHLYPNREYIQDTIEKELKDIGEVDVAEGYMIYREGKHKIHENDISPMQFTINGIHKELVRKTLTWNIEQECDSVLALNDWVNGHHGKDLKELIKLSDERYRKDVLAVVDKIADIKDDIKVVIIAGPSCSNKTTTTVIAGMELQKIGMKLKQLNIDDYFKGLQDQPKDEFGDYDFEMPEAIDMELLNQNLADLLDGKEIEKPCYDFKSGTRTRYEPFCIEADEIILIDCLHGLHRNLTMSVPQLKKFKIYIETMNVLRDVNGAYTRWADVRMLKRMIRDVQHRGYSTSSTLAHWPYVRKGELKHIVPYILSTDAVLNAGLPYELPALKTSLKDKFPTLEFREKLRAEGRLAPYIRGVRTSTLLETIDEIENLDIIPGKSPLREFIGGSEYFIPHNE